MLNTLHTLQTYFNVQPFRFKMHTNWKNLTWNLKTWTKAYMVVVLVKHKMILDTEKHEKENQNTLQSSSNFLFHI